MFDVLKTRVDSAKVYGHDGLPHTVRVFTYYTHAHRRIHQYYNNMATHVCCVLAGTNDANYYYCFRIVSTHRFRSGVFDCNDRIMRLYCIECTRYHLADSIGACSLLRDKSSDLRSPRVTKKARFHTLPDHTHGYDNTLEKAETNSHHRQGSELDAQNSTQICAYRCALRLKKHRNVRYNTQ